MVGLRPFVVSLVAVVLFSFFILAFVGNVIEEQNPTSEVFNENYNLNSSKNRMNNLISNFSDISQGVYSDMEESEPSATDYIFLIFKGAFYIPYSFLIFAFQGIIAIASLLFLSFSSTGLGILLGVIISAISSVLIVTVVFLIIKAIRSGESER